MNVDRAIANLERAFADRRPTWLPDNFASLPRSERVELLLTGTR